VEELTIQNEADVRNYTVYRKSCAGSWGIWHAAYLRTLYPYERDTVVENFGFPGSDKILLYIDEAMSWECVRDLNRMYPLINLIHNLAKQHEAPESIYTIVEVRRNFGEVRTAFIKGETD